MSEETIADTPAAEATAPQLASPQAFDLSKWQAWQDLQDAGVWFPFAAPDGSPTTIQVKVRGPDSKRVRREILQMQNGFVSAATGRHYEHSPEERSLMSAVMWPKSPIASA